MIITGLNKAEILVALYNRSKVQGLGYLRSPGPTFLGLRSEPISIEFAEELLKKQKVFDYLNGTVLQIDLSDDDLDTSLYNRDNGENAAENALKPLFDKLESESKISLSILLIETVIKITVRRFQ